MGGGLPLCLLVSRKDQDTATVQFEHNEESAIDADHDPTFPLSEFLGSPHHQEGAQTTDDCERHDDVNE